MTVYITVVGTALNILLTSLTAYPLSKTYLPGREKLMLGVIITMLFSGGMIPSYILVKSLGMINSFSALIIPGAISAFNLIIIKNFFQQLPKELEESAKIDGCNDVRILIQIILPLSMPVLATFSLFYAVSHWNTFMAAILYLNDAKKWPIQILLRQIVILSSGGFGDITQLDNAKLVIPPRTVQLAAITVATAPILTVYPFLQKYFVKGVLLGSVKG